MPVIGYLSNKVDPRYLLTFGFGLFGLATLYFGNITLQISPTTLLLPILLTGFALSFVFVPISTAAYGTLSNDKIGNASGIFNLMRNVGGSIGISMAQTLLTRRTTAHQNLIINNVPVSGQQFQNSLGAAQQSLRSYFGPANSLPAAQATLYQQPVVRPHRVDVQESETRQSPGGSSLRSQWEHLCRSGTETVLYPRGMIRRNALAIAFLALCCFSPALPGQWKLEQSGTAADLRGIASVNERVAWASGSGGTILRTVDGGRVWLRCTSPDGAETLDFRGIQAWDKDSALVLAAGPGDRSRMYRTADGCKTWKLLLKNPDDTGFWDAIRFVDRQHGRLLGDPVDGQFVVMTTADGGSTWARASTEREERVQDKSIFAASNSALLTPSAATWLFCTGGRDGPTVVEGSVGLRAARTQQRELPSVEASSTEELKASRRSASSGCFSLAASRGAPRIVVAVGGDYADPQNRADTAWTTAREPASPPNFPLRFFPAITSPHGYRSAVVFDSRNQLWIAVGPNGTDISSDNGQNWQAATSGNGEAAGWNAISLPFVVGPHGRIARIDAAALARAPAKDQ